MSTPDVDHLIVGGGVAAVECVSRLRELEPSASILVASRELELPYDRTWCSKHYLAGTRSREDAQLRGEDWWRRAGTELRTRTSVTGIDPEARTATLSTRERLSFGNALLATGATVRRLSPPGAELKGIHYLRALGNADALREDISDADEVVLVGGSYIGCEVAATLTTMGKHCTVLMQERVPLEHHLGTVIGGWVGDLLHGHGISFIGGDRLDRLEGDGVRVTHVVTCGGRRLPARAVVIGVGATPDARLAQKSGLAIGTTGGISCGADLRTSAPGIFAAGDACEWESKAHRARARVEHWNVAAAQGRTAAENMLGAKVPYADVPDFWSDLADWGSLKYVGVGRGNSEILRGSVDNGAFSVWFFAADRLNGVVSVGRDEDLDHALRLVGSSLSPERRRELLADPDADLAEMAT
jgi:3-phenylpropionate/trans-cinnamate dioxygenase ferredoxin reductase component